MLQVVIIRTDQDSEKMATLPAIGGHSCEFVDKPHIYLFCKLCNRVAKEAIFITCCGENFCKDCISSERHSCPSCHETEFSLNPNVKYRKEISDLQAHCPLKDRGCEWIGKLQEHKLHLDLDTGDCQFVDVTCPNKCGRPVPRCEVANHPQNECPERDFFCQYCNYTASYDVVCNQHYDECEYCPVLCPNSCSVVSVERGVYEDHLKMCPYQRVQCVYAHAGCQESFIRELEDKHMEENTQKHLSLMSHFTLKLGQEFEKNISELRKEFQGYAKKMENEMHDQTKQKDKKIVSLEKKMEKMENETHKKFQVYVKKMENETHEQMKEKDEKIVSLEKKMKKMEQKAKAEDELRKQNAQNLEERVNKTIQANEEMEEKLKANEDKI